MVVRTRVSDAGETVSCTHHYTYLNYSEYLLPKLARHTAQAPNHDTQKIYVGLKHNGFLFFDP